jgi:signal transduction histidine kinase
LVGWWRLDGLTARRQRERDTFGVELPDLGRRLSERWRCDELVVDATWLHSERTGTLAWVASDAARIGYIQQACELVEETPWSLNRPADPGRMPSDPRLKMIIAEVQSRTGVPFIAADASVHEERACRQVAILRSRLAESYRQRRRSERLLSEISRPDAAATVDEWASSAALAWCAEPEVTAARVVWKSDPGVAKSSVIEARDGEPLALANNREPSLIIPVRAGTRYRGELQVWSAGATAPLIDRMDQSIEWRAWQAWSELIAASESSEQRLRLIVSAHREQAELEEERLVSLKLDALGEFAGGAGHELNNPLAVIAGRAQLLMARTNDAHATKSLKVIQAQVKRAHQILRDLIFVARPPEPRQRMCRPSEILRFCVKEFEEPCVARGVRLVAQLDESVPATWADFDGLRHVGEVLLRNALQATPPGGKIQVQSVPAGSAFVWRFIDNGHGIGPEAATHLFDPFYCGRQAGRGLGLGLPRAALIVEQGEGQLQWTSNPGVETVFSVRMPVRPAPEIAAA